MAAFFATLFQPHQETRHQACALDQTVDLDVFVERVKTRAADADGIERRDAERAG